MCLCAKFPALLSKHLQYSKSLNVYRTCHFATQLTQDQISEAVSPHFPNAKYTAVGAFVFLRFICPAIVAPEAEGLVSVAPTKEMRRGLLLIAKVIQNLANNVLFGTKEPYMFPLNPFLVQNIHLVTGFLREISVSQHSYFSDPLSYPGAGAVRKRSFSC